MDDVPMQYDPQEISSDEKKEDLGLLLTKVKMTSDASIALPSMKNLGNSRFNLPENPFRQTEYDLH